MIIGASSLIVLACSLVIYSLFYISVIGKTHEYGRLRVLGATSVQIKRIVRKESFLLSCAAIPIGVVLGSVFGLLFRPGRLALVNYTGMCRCDCPCYRNCLENCCPYPYKESLYGIAY